MDVVAILAVGATTLIGALGVIVPAVTKQGDRKHETELEQQRDEFAHATKIREQQSSAYARLWKAMAEHKALDDNPPHTRYMQWLGSVSEWAAAADEPSRPDVMPEKVEITTEQIETWMDRRSAVLSSAFSDVGMWASHNMISAWHRLEMAASKHDSDLMVQTYPKDELGDRAAEEKAQISWS